MTMHRIATWLHRTAHHLAHTTGGDTSPLGFMVAATIALHEETIR